MSQPLIQAVKQGKSLDEILDLCTMHTFETDVQGRTALMHAILVKNVEVAKVLMCETGKFDKQAKNAYMYSIEMGLSEIQKLIEQLYADKEVQVEVPGLGGTTVWQYMKAQHAQPDEQDVNLFGSLQSQQEPEAIEVNIASVRPSDQLSSRQPNLDSEPPGLPLPSKSTRIQKPVVNEQVIASKALLTSKQFQSCQQAEYFIKALQAGCTSQFVKQRAKTLVLDGDVMQVICAEFQLRAEELTAALQ